MSDSPAGMLKVVVAGCGSIGTRHMRNLAAIGASVTAVDVDADRRAAVVRDYGIPAVASIEQAWSGTPDAVVVATSTASHVAMAAAAIERGCAVFVEKPLAAARAGLDALVAESEARGLVTMVACNMRFHPGPAAVRRLLDDRAIGDLLSARIETGSYLPAWRPATDYRTSYSASRTSGGALLDCVHEVDLAVWFFGPGRLAACEGLQALSIGLDTDGLAELLVRHESGVLSSIHLNFLQRNYHRRCHVIGAGGTIYWDFNAGEVLVYGRDGDVSTRIAQPAGWTVNDMYADEMKHFVDAVISGQPTANSLGASLAALDLVLEARGAEMAR